MQKMKSVVRAICAAMIIACAIAAATSVTGCGAFNSPSNPPSPPPAGATAEQVTKYQGELAAYNAALATATAKWQRVEDTIGTIGSAAAATGTPWGSIIASVAAIAGLGVGAYTHAKGVKLGSDSSDGSSPIPPKT